MKSGGKVYIINEDIPHFYQIDTIEFKRIKKYMNEYFI